MSLIKCPECGKEISDKAESCPHCGLPSKHFANPGMRDQKIELGIKKVWQSITKLTLADNPEKLMDITVNFDPKEFRNALISFDRDYETLFSAHEYINTNGITSFKSYYGKYFELLQNELIFQYLITNAVTLQIDEMGINRFYNKMQHITQEVEQFNNLYIDKKLIELKDYFDHIMYDIDAGIKLDEEQRRAVIIDDNHCLVVAGAGAGKTTTMAAKVKYLVEKQQVDPHDIIVISYTNKAVNELKDRINKNLKIPAKISTFHAFAFDVVRKANENSPDINISSYNIIDDMLVNLIFDNKKLMRNLVLFMGYYFDLPEDIFNFKSLNEYHLYKSAIDYETLKSGLGEYVLKVSTQRGRSNRTITGEFLRSMQEVQIANFLYLNGIDYVYEKPYPSPMLRSKKKYTPDFFISQDKNEAYLEHYGLTESLKSFVFTPQQIARYQKSISDKRSLHKKNETKLIETWSFYNDKRPLIDHLHEILVKNGFIMKPRDSRYPRAKLVVLHNSSFACPESWRH